MTHDQYLAIYARERKTKSPADAGYIVFRAMLRDMVYRESKIGRTTLQDRVSTIKYFDTIWQLLSIRNPELKKDGFIQLLDVFDAEKLLVNEIRQVRLTRTTKTS